MHKCITGLELNLVLFCVVSSESIKRGILFLYHRFILFKIQCTEKMTVMIRISRLVVLVPENEKKYFFSPDLRLHPLRRGHRSIKVLP